MSKLLLIRHAQASFMKDNYDELSELGFVQSEHLGKYLVDNGYHFDRIFVGPLKRQKQTLEFVEKQYKTKQIPFPEIEELSELKEHTGMEQLVECYDLFLSKNDYCQQLHQQGIQIPKLKRRNRLLIFEDWMQKWTTDNLGFDLPDHLETWQQFRKRVAIGMQKMLSIQERGIMVGAFTSGGVIASVAGQLLSVGDESKVADLNGQIINTSFSEVLFSGRKVSLRSLNNVPHLTVKELITNV